MLSLLPVKKIIGADDVVSRLQQSLAQERTEKAGAAR